MTKILIVPSKFITDVHRRELTRWKNLLYSFKKLDFKKAFESFNSHMLCAELYNYADIPNINGQQNTFIVGNYYEEYTSKSIPKDTRYPSIHNNSKGTHINLPEALNMITSFDCILIGIRSNKIGNIIRRKALKHDVPVVILDHFDHPEVYQDPSYEKIFRGLKPKKDFNLYFKHDLPLGTKINNLVYPLAPTPCNPNNYPSIKVSWSDKDISVFYRGRNSHNPREDRSIIVNEIKNKIKFSKIQSIDQKNMVSIYDYVSNLSKSKIALSPSGKVWDSTRHCEIGLFNCAPLIPEPDCEVVNNLIKDSENAITYKVNYQQLNKKYNIQDIDLLIDKINFFLVNDKKLKEMANKWGREILQNHTVYARSNMILDKIRSIN